MTNNKINKECKFCGKFFRWTSSLKLHLRIHTNERPYSCSKCGKTFTQKIHLQRHLPVHHQPGRNVRANNDFVLGKFVNKFDITMSHKASSPAAACGQVSPVNSTDGAPTTTTTEDIRCQECDTTFDRWLDLLQHTSEAHPRLEDQQDMNNDEAGDETVVEGSNSGDSKLRTTWCHICKKHLATVSSRNLHMRIHTGERPFACNVCGKSFTQNVHLRSHMSVHTGAKPYLCKVCNKGFVAGRTLKIHMMSHTREQPHTCQWCSRKFLIRQHLITHMATHHGEMLQNSDVDEEEEDDDDDDVDVDDSPPTMVATSQMAASVASSPSPSATASVTLVKPNLSGLVASPNSSIRSKRKSTASLHKNRRKQRAIDANHGNSIVRRFQSFSQQRVVPDEGEDDNVEEDELAKIITSMDTADDVGKDLPTVKSELLSTTGQHFWEESAGGGGNVKVGSFSELFETTNDKHQDAIVEEKLRPIVSLKPSRRKCPTTSRAARHELQQHHHHNNNNNNNNNNNRSSPSSSNVCQASSSCRINSNNTNGVIDSASPTASFQAANGHNNNIMVSNGHNNNNNSNSNSNAAVVSSQNVALQKSQQQQMNNSNSNSLACNRNRHNDSVVGVVGTSMQQCPNCMLVEGELHLLKTELAMIKQFLGNKLTLMEQKIDNMTTMIRQ